MAEFNNLVELLYEPNLPVNAPNIWKWPNKRDGCSRSYHLRLLGREEPTFPQRSIGFQDAQEGVFLCINCEWSDIESRESEKEEDHRSLMLIGASCIDV